MPHRPLSVVLLVIGTMSFVVWAYALTLALICLRHDDPEGVQLALAQFKDFGIYSAGALSGFLTSVATKPNATDAPTPVNVTNPPNDPVNTAETK